MSLSTEQTCTDGIETGIQRNTHTHTRKKSQRRAIKIEIMYCQQSLTLWIFARIGANRNGAKIQRVFLFVSCAGKWAAIAVKKSETDTNECINKVFCVLKGYMKWGAHLVGMQTADVLALIFATPGQMGGFRSSNHLQYIPNENQWQMERKKLRSCA